MSSRFVVLLVVFGLFLEGAAQNCADGSAPDGTTCTGTTDTTSCTAPNTCQTLDDGTSFGCCAPATTTVATTTAAGGTTAAGATTTKKATTVANTCKDIQTNCASYKDLCSNSVYKNMLAQKCAKTCKFCKSTDCVDAKTECANWKTLGFCDSASYTDATKKAYCGATCSKC